MNDLVCAKLKEIVNLQDNLKTDDAYCFLTLSAPGCVSLIMPWGERGGGGIKFGTVILCNVTKKMIETNFQNCSYRDDGVTNYANFLKKLCGKGLKYASFFFLKLTLW